MEEAEPQLIAAAADGDHDAFASIVRVYQTRLLRYLRRFLDDASLAEDVAQDAFLSCFRNLHRYGFEGRFSTWLLSIAHNAAIDAVRRRARAQRNDTMLTPRATTTPDPLARIELEEALAQLSEKHRAALLLVEVTGLRYREAAQVLGVAEGTVKSRVSHARDRLVAWYADEGEGGDEADALR
ncbi:MAG: RNA polymerase sigma factor [Actinomycetota bacterium]